MEVLRKFQTREFLESGSVHALLANLPLPVYLSTTYDDFMMEALRLSNEAPVPVVVPLE